jgi:hypothetical protein
MNSAIRLAGITVGTTTRRSKSKRLPACTILASCAMPSFIRGGFIRDRTRVMVYSSRRMFRMDSITDVERNLFSAAQLWMCIQREEKMYLFLTHDATWGVIAGILPRFQHHPHVKLEETQCSLYLTGSETNIYSTQDFEEKQKKVRTSKGKLFTMNANLSQDQGRTKRRTIPKVSPCDASNQDSGLRGQTLERHEKLRWRWQLRRLNRRINHHHRRIG